MTPRDRFALLVSVDFVIDDEIWHACFGYGMTLHHSNVPSAAKYASRMQRPPNHRYPRRRRRQHLLD
ncbi:MAG: hypothetical protein EOP37_03380 [Rubrivivax sp.]|nr:MAG: hypothetical protein EOP37_03380 [Rubrivivax sp.]